MAEYEKHLDQRANILYEKEKTYGVQMQNGKIRLQNFAFSVILFTDNLWPKYLILFCGQISNHIR